MPSLSPSVETRTQLSVKRWRRKFGPTHQIWVPVLSSVIVWPWASHITSKPCLLSLFNDVLNCIDSRDPLQSWFSESQQIMKQSGKSLCLLWGSIMVDLWIIEQQRWVGERMWGEGAQEHWREKAKRQFKGFPSRLSPSPSLWKLLFILFVSMNLPTPVSPISGSHFSENICPFLTGLFHIH